MRQAERLIIRKAVMNIMDDDGDFNEGIAELCKLCGMHYEAGRILRTVTPVSIEDVASRPNTAFYVALEPKP